MDKDIRFGETYEYRAQRVARGKVDGQNAGVGWAVFGADAGGGCRMCFRQPYRAGLAAVAIAGENGASAAIDLSWQPDTEADLAGYIVYRREGDGGLAAHFACATGGWASVS